MAKEKKQSSAFMQPVKLSAELEAIVGKGPMPRTEVIKKLWEYIKKNNLQDPNKKRMIVPDELLAAVFGGKEAIDMFKMNSIVFKKHLTKM